MHEQAKDTGLRPTKVLVVDDEPSLVDLVRSYLEADGFVVSEAYDGPSALEVAAQEQPQVVVLDVILRWSYRRTQSAREGNLIARIRAQPAGPALRFEQAPTANKR